MVRKPWVGWASAGSPAAARAASTCRSGSRVARSPAAIAPRVWPPAASARACAVGVAELAVQPGQAAASDERTSGSVLPKATAWSSFSNATVGFLLQRLRVGQVLLADADAVDDDEVGLALGVGRDGLEVGRR